MKTDDVLLSGAKEFIQEAVYNIGGTSYIQIFVNIKISSRGEFNTTFIQQ